MKTQEISKKNAQPIPELSFYFHNTYDNGHMELSFDSPFEKNNNFNPFLGVAPILKKEEIDNSNSDEVVSLIEPKYGKISVLKKFKKFRRAATFHIEMKNIEDYEKNKNYFLEKNRGYNYEYYLSFKINNNIHFQVHYSNVIAATYTMLALDSSFLPPLNNFEDLNNLLEGENIFDISVNTRIIGFINLRSGPDGGNIYYKMNEKILKFCGKNNIKYIDYKKPE